MILRMYDYLTDFGKKVIMGVLLSALLFGFLAGYLVMLG